MFVLLAFALGPSWAYADTLLVEPERITVVQTALNARNLGDLMDLRGLTQRATADLTGPHRRQVRRLARSADPLSAIGFPGSGSGTQARAVSVLPDRAIYRILDPEGTVDYLHVAFVEGRIVDLTLASDGLSLAEQLAWPEGRDARRQVIAALREAPYDAALVQARVLRSQHPDEIWMDLQLLERALDERDWVTFASRLQRIDDIVGGDPWMQVLQGLAAEALGRPEEGARRRALATARDPSLQGQPYLPSHLRTSPQLEIVGLGGE